MRLQDKIKEIQQKPEHIRLRYVWGCVFVSMFFIVVLWVFSMTAGRVQKEQGLSENQIMQQFQTQKQSMEDYKDQFKDMQENFKDLQEQVMDSNGDVSEEDFINSNQ